MLELGAMVDQLTNQQIAENLERKANQRASPCGVESAPKAKNLLETMLEVH